MKTVISFLLTIVFTSAAGALLKLPTKTTYESGRFLCEQKYASVVAFEKGFYTTVPSDYANPARGTTEVYAHFSGEFDPKKETLLHFTGGPGQGTHWGLFNNPMPHNTLLVENRGVGCSRPPTLEQMLSPSFYSSEFVARDALLVLKKLGLKKVSVYGVSYGTIPATIFASLFPESTRAVILEGTVFSGTEDLWAAPHRRKLLQKMLDGLPAEIKEKMDSIHTQYGITDLWFSQTARTTMLYTDGLNKLRDEMLALADEQDFQDKLLKLKKMYAPMNFEPHILFATDDIVYSMLACQEMSLANPKVTPADALVDGKLIPAVDPELLGTCVQLGTKATRTYYATKYPVKVPVTYFQGSDDSATPSPQGINHYKQVPQGFAQLLILVRGGHNPNLGNLASEESGQAELFAHAFNGTAIPPELLKQVQKDQDQKWVYTKKEKP